MAAGSAAIKRNAAGGDKGSDEEQPFVLDGNRLYLQRYFRYETRFLQRLYEFLETESALIAERTALLRAHKELVARLFDSPGGQQQPDWQLAAAVTGVLNNFTIITGGPGTGKTTTVAKILAILYAADPSVKVALAAPTGKAAARMAESLRNTQLPLSLTPSTIHRLLRPKQDTPYFRHDRENPLNHDVVIVDECSMIDVALFCQTARCHWPDHTIDTAGR